MANSDKVDRAIKAVEKFAVALTAVAAAATVLNETLKAQKKLESAKIKKQ